MAYIYRKPRTRRDPATGRRVPVLDAAGRPVMLPRWYIEYRDWQGERAHEIGALDRVETGRIAARLEAEQDDIRRGHCAPPPDAGADAPTFAAAVRDYLAWGRAAGGRRKQPWDPEHAAKRAARLAWWIQELKVDALARLADPDVVDRARDRLAALESVDGLTGKTAAHYREALVCFGTWATREKRLDANPFLDLPIPDTAPVRIRRAATLTEIHALLGGVPLWRRLLYELAFASGFRAGELRALDLDMLDPDGVRLPAWADKGRRKRFQELWPDLAARLRAYALTDDARRRYAAAYAKRDQPIPDDVPARPLVYVPVHPTRPFAADCRRAGVAVRTAEGRLDFHAARVAYINLVMDAGAETREAQALARHATESITQKVYARAKKNKKSDLAEKVGRMVAGADCPSTPRDGTNPDKSGQNDPKPGHPPAGTTPEPQKHVADTTPAPLPSPPPQPPPDNDVAPSPATPAPENVLGKVGGYTPPTLGTM